MLAAVALLAAGCGDEGGRPKNANADCAPCHATQADAFATSRHARATESDLFRALRARAGAQQAFCDGCHAPHEADGERGVGCVTCHAAIGNRGTSNARLIHDVNGPVRGPFADAHATRAHGSARSDFVLDSALCGTCHEVAGPGALVETPYSEWSRSPAARMGLTCAGCHMSPRPGEPHAARAQGSAAVGAPPRALSDHAFVGVDHPRAGELLAGSASLDLRVGGRGGRGVDVVVTVRNHNPGHALPSGARFAREVWIELVAVDTRGREHVVSGGVNEDGAPVADDPQRVDLGERVSVHALLEGPPPAHHAVPAGGERAFAYIVPIAWEGAGVASVRARLRLRRNAWALRSALGLPPDRSAPFDLATAGAAVP